MKNLILNLLGRRTYVRTIQPFELIAQEASLQAIRPSNAEKYCGRNLLRA